jgi:hypothetical protein
MTKKKVPLMSHTLKSKMGLFRVDDGWILIYPHPDGSGRQVQEVYTHDDESIVNILYTIKENCLYHYNSKHNEYNILIERKKVKK